MRLGGQSYSVGVVELLNVLYGRTREIEYSLVHLRFSCVLKFRDPAESEMRAVLAL